MTTNVPKPILGPTGFQAPTQAQILAGVQADINAAFGGGLNPSLTTPQGQLASSIAAIVGEANDAFLNLTSQVDPAFAAGNMQDAIGRIYFIERMPALSTIVQATCTGLNGVVIPVGALAQATDGNVYQCTQAGTISGGSVVLPFACVTPGPIPCPATTLNAIFQAITGWSSVNNTADGVIGQNVESRVAFETRRAASVGQNSIGSLPSILGAVLGVAGVLDAYVTENTSGSPATIGGVSLAAHSLYVAAVGGISQLIGNAIWSKKAPGCGYNGNTTVTVIDSNSGYVAPLPSYQVTFQIPAALPIIFAISLANNPLVPANAVTLIQNAIVSAFAGGDGGPRARIGSTIFASRFYSALAALGSWVNIISTFIGSQNATEATFTGGIVGTALTVSAVTGTIAIGRTLKDTAGAVLAGTTIVSGSGLNWVVSRTQNVSASAMQTISPTLTQIGVNINQTPTINANDIAVTLV